MPACSYNVPCISFPSRSHPNICRIEEELNKLSSWEPSSTNAETIRARLSGPGEIYRCIEDLLNLPLTQQALAKHQQEKRVGDMLDDLMMYIDICGNTRDAILLMKETIRELQSALRRTKVGGDPSSIETNVNAYIFSRKKLKKDAAKLLALLKRKDSIFSESSLLIADDHYLCKAVKALREASYVTIAIFNSLLLFLSARILKPKQSKWSLLSRLVHKGMVACEGEKEKMNVLGNVDFALTILLVPKDLDLQKIESAQKMLEIVNITMEELENVLGYLFRHMIHTRVSLLNIVSHQLE